PEERPQLAKLAELPQPKRYDEFAELALKEARKRPDLTLARRLYAALAFFVGERWLEAWEVADVAPPAGGGNGAQGWLRQAAPGTLQATLLGLLFLSFFGWRWSYGWRWESMPAALAMVWVPLPYILSHAEGLSGPRLPLDGVLLCYAAFAVACFLPR